MPQPPTSVYQRIPDDIATRERKRRQAEQDRIDAIADREAKSKAESDRARKEDESQRARLSKLRVSQPPDLRHLEMGDKTVKVKETSQSVYGDKVQAEEGKRAEAARRKRQEALAKHLEDYGDDPMSQMLGTGDFALKEYDAEQAKRKAERDKIIAEHPDDPMAQMLAIGEHHLKQRDAQSPASQAFAKNEAMQRMKRVDEVQSRFADDGTGNAFVRETFGALRNTGAAITALTSRLTGNSEAADEVHRKTNEYDAAQQQARDANDMSPWLSRQFGGAAQSFLQAAGTPGGAYSKLAGAGVLTGDQAITTGKDAGLKGAALARYVGTQTALETGIAAISQRFAGPGFESRMAGEMVAANTMKQLVKNFGSDAFKEGVLEEIPTSLLQDLSSMYEGVSPDMTLEDFVSHASDALAQSVLMVGMSHAPNAAAIASQPQEPPQNPEFAPEPNLIDSTRQSVFPGKQAPAPAVPPAVEAFANGPSRKTYDAAVASGMKPLERSTKNSRDQYAEGWLKTLGMRKPDPATGNRTAQDQPESTTATVPDDESGQFLDQFKNLYLKRDQNEAKNEARQEGNKAAEGQAAERMLRPEESPVATGEPSPDPSPTVTDLVSAPVQRHQSAIKKYPSKIPDPYNEPGRPQREFDAPPVYLTGVSNAESREEAKTMPNLGVMVTPKTQQYRTHLKDYQFFGVDNGAFTGKFNEKGFYKLLDNIREQGDAGKALFAAAPDVVGDWQATLKASEPHLDRIRDAGFPVAIVLQNGATVETVPWDRIDALFVGGNDRFKLGVKEDGKTLDLDGELAPIIKEAKKRDVPIHFGRVNSAKRLELTHYGFGGQSADGTFIKFGKPDQQTDKVMSWLKPWGKFPDKTPSTTATEPRYIAHDIRDKILAIANPFIGKDTSDDAALQTIRNAARKVFGAAMIQATKDGTLERDAAWFNSHTPDDFAGTVAAYRKRQSQPTPKPTGPKAGRSLRNIILAQGGISAKSLRKDYNQKELKSDGLLGVMRIAGQPLDEIAQVLESSGDLRTPKGRNPADWLIEQLKLNADGARAEYSDAEIEKQLEAERKLYDQRKEHGVEAAVLDGLRERSEEAETHAVDAGQDSFVPFTESEASEIIDASFDFGAYVESKADDDSFELKRPEKPKPKAEDFGVNANSKQGGLFDAGKKNELPGQNLLFNSDPGDLNNPKTQENKAKAAESQKAATPAAAPAESDIKAAMRAELAKQAAEDAAAKPPLGALTVKDLRSGKETVIPEKAPAKRPAKTKAPRTVTGEKLGKLSEDTGKAAKQAMDDFLKDVRDLGVLSGINNKALVATAKMVRAQVADGVVKFADFVARFAEYASPATARKLSDYLETAWEILAETNSNLDNAGKVADVLGPEKEVTNEDTGTTGEGEAPSDKSVGGMPGESGGTLATSTGESPEGGDTEAVSGSDGDAISDGTDGTAETESEGTGTGTEGTGTEQGSGTKPQSGRKAAVKGSRKPTIRVPRQVGTPVNLRIGPDDTIAPGGVVSKLKANIAAIKLLKELQTENRQATDAEQRILMQYTGWGSLQHVFDENRGKEFIARPGLADQYGEWYKKALMYQKEGQYSSLEQLRTRVEAWEKQWGESYRFLKENLTPDEWKRAKASVLNAHFTSREVITNGIWGALEQMGVTGGRFMEPSSGIGSLIGLMPEAIANDSEVIAIELDSLTGDMVKQLYPEADVHVKGFEEVPIPAGTIDVAATNVPFHQIGPADAKTRYGRDMNLHNYFIARILDSLRPGGIAAVITTHFTMDANSEDRALLASKADLVGAIRLPNTAFKANAGTEVTTDILFFRKPDGSPFKGASWGNLASVGTYTREVRKKKKGPLVNKESSISVNEYFAAHPEMVLGSHSMDGTQYSDTEYTVMPVQGANIADQLQAAVKNLPAGIATTDNAPLMPSLDTGTAGVDGRIEFRGGKLQEMSGGEWKAPAWLKDAMTLTKKGEPRKLTEDTKAKKIADAVTQGIAYTKVRNAYETHLANMRNAETTQAEYEKSQKALNTAYDAYRAKNGDLNHKDSKWLVRDPGFFFASGLEDEVELVENNESLKRYAKADVFRERTVNPDAAPTKADTTEDAVKMSLAWRGAINLPWMSELTGTSKKDLEAELLESGTVFLNPETSVLEPADTYLAGNVQAKLRQSEKAVAEGDKRFERNVEMLKNVQPPKRTIDSITPSLGQSWVPHEVVNRWLAEVVKLPNATVRYNSKADIWSVNTGGIPRDVQNEWGTLGMHLSDLLPKTLNGSTIRIMKPNLEDSKKSVLDEAQTQAAQIKAEKMRDSFEAWAKSDEKSIPLIEQAFNEQKNFYVKPQYNGEHLAFPGMSELWLKRMRPYQKNTIWRAIREGRGMIAHGVGAGKTAELIAIAMEMKRLGTATKPLIVVQNSTLGQFARTFTEVYPAAKVLVASKDDLNPENRARFMARIATGNWDAIVMAKSTFNQKLPNDPALEKAMVEGLIAELEAVMLEAQLEDGAGSPSVKAIQQQINSLIKRLEKIIDRVNARTDSDVFFEKMGVDALFLDEAHDYKKPPFVTKLDRSIKGLSTDVSGRALSALIKMRFIQGNNRGRNTFMATGTPITNTLGESWLLMNMVAPDVLREFGVTTFDQFVATFARVISSLEPNAVGKLQRKTRLAKFKNGHQLAQFIQSGWDVLLGEDLHSKIREYGGGKIPKMENGKETLVMVDRSPAFDAFGKFFLDVYSAYKELTGEDKRTYSWIPVVIYGAAKAAAIDVRLVDPSATDDPGSKLNKMVEGVYQAYKEGTDVTLHVGDQEMTGQNLTQLIFSDVSGRTDTSKLRSFASGEGVTMEIVEDDESDSEDESDDDDAPSASKAKEDRWLYNEIKRKLVEKGIPEDQVQLITDHNGTAEKLLAFQDRVNAGDVRIVIGHSDTLGTGVNVQTRLKAIWELDIPMVPSKREQRIGRMIRSGNLNEIVQSFVMAMQRSLDSNLMSMNLRKAKAAEQALSGKSGAEFEDPFSESLMSMADMEAAMNDDPLFYRQRDLEFQVRSLRLEAEALDQQRSRERSRLRGNEFDIERANNGIAEQTAIAIKVEAALEAKHPFVIEGKKIDALKDAEKALKAKYDPESERISKETRDNKIKALANYYSPESDHVAADAEYGPMQFNLVYGERPEVVQDDKGNPVVRWTSTSGTIVTMGGKKIEETKATTLSSIMKFLKESVPATRNWIAARQKTVAELTAENVKLAAFLDKPSDTQIALDNLESQLAQVNQLMFDRDNPPAAPHAPATPAAVPVESDLRKAAAEAKEAIVAQKAKNARYGSVIRDEWEKITRGEIAGSGLPLTNEMLNAIGNRMFGSVKLGVKRFDALIKELRAEFDESIIVHLKPTLIAMWNTTRNKYGLDEATTAVFDDAMSDTVDVDVEQAVEAAKRAQPAINDREPAIADREPAATEKTPAQSQNGGARLGDDTEFSTKNDSTDAMRSKYEMRDRLPADRTSRSESIVLAKEYGGTKAGSDEINKLIRELTSRPRSTTPWENDLLNYRQAELDTKFEGSLEQKVEATKAGDDVQAAFHNAESRVHLGEMQALITLLSDPISKLLGRALQARKAMINRDYSVARSTLIYEAAYGKAPEGKELEAIVNMSKDLEAKVKELQQMLADEETKNSDLQTKLKEAHDALVNKANLSPPAEPEETPEPTAATKQPAEKPASSDRKDKARKKINDAYKRIASMLKEGTAFSVGGALGESASVFVDLATGYSELGVISLGQFLKRVSLHMGPAAKQLVPQLTAAWKQVRATAGQADISNITDKIDPIDNDTIGRAARTLHAFVIERDGLDASAEGREAAIDAVHAILVDFVPELTRDQTARAMSGIGIYSELSDDEIEVIRRDQKAQLLSLEQIGDWEKGTPPPATGQERPPVSDEQRLLRKMVNEAKKASGISTTTEGQLRSALDAAKRMANNRITNLTKAIESGERISKSQKLLKSDAELEALRVERDALQKLYDQAFGKAELSDEQRLNMAEKALDRAINGLEADLNAGKLYADAPKSKLTSPAIEAKRAVLDALKANRDELRLTSPESQARSDAAYERHLLERSAKLAQRLDDGDFMPAAKKPARVLNDKMLKLMKEIAESQAEIKKIREDWEFRNRHLVYKMGVKGPLALATLIRKGLTAFDDSLIGRQGRLLMWNSPKIWATAASKSFGSNWIKGRSIFPTKQDLFNTQAALDADENWIRLEKIAKLAVTDVHGGIAREEGHQYAPEWMNKVPGVGGSERAGSAFINTQRRLMFRYFVEKLAAKHARNGVYTMSDSELRVIGNGVNVPSGRGDIGRYLKGVEGVSHVFFSPQWWASRVMWLTGEPIWSETRWRGGEGASTEVRKLMAVEWGKQVVGQAAFISSVIGIMYAMLGAPGDDEEWQFFWDPRSPYFGHIRYRDTYQDMTAGVAQHVSVLFRLFSKQQLNRWEGVVETDKVTVGRRYIQGKLAPVPSMFADYVFNPMDPTVEFGSSKWLKGHVEPLMLQDVEKSMKEGPVLGSALSVLAFFGQSSRTQEARVKERGDVANELRALKNRGGSPEKIQKIMGDHLKHTAGLEAKQALKTVAIEDHAGLQKVIDVTESPELTAAIRKEKFDIILNASARVSTDKRRVGEEKEFSGGDDKGRMTARYLVPMMIPDVEDAIELYDAAYKSANRTLMERKGGQWIVKSSVWAGRARIRQLYESN